MEQEKLQRGSGLWMDNYTMTEQASKNGYEQRSIDQKRFNSLRKKVMAAIKGSLN